MRQPRPISVERLIRGAAAQARSERTITIEVSTSSASNANYFPKGRYHHLVASYVVPTAYPSYGFSLAPELLALEDGSCGLSLCVDVLGQVCDPLHVLTEVNRLLADAGWLYLVSPLVVGSIAAHEPTRRVSLGINYLLEAAGFLMMSHQGIRDRTDYAVVARKTRTLGHRRPNC